MSGRRWRVDLSAPARFDLDGILDETLELFGTAQARRYHQLITDAVRELQQGPDHVLARRQADPGDQLWTLVVRRRGRPARHLLLYRVTGAKAIEVLRILHDAMDLPRHFGLHEDAALYEPGP